MWLTLLGWVNAIRRWRQPSRPPASDTHALAQTTDTLRELAQTADQHRELAQELDHCVSPARPAAQTINPHRELAQTVDRLRVLLGLRIDGGTAWQLKAPPAGWALYPGLRMRLDRGQRTVQLLDARGDPVDLSLEWEHGAIVLKTSYLRLDLRRHRAEVQITALSAEVEGVAAWFLRELPRVAWWLLGVDITDAVTTEAVRSAARGLGIRQRRIEMCIDGQGGVVLAPGIEHTVISKLKVTPFVSRPGEVEGLEIGKRHETKDENGGPKRKRTPNDGMSFSIYRKLDQLAAKRGPERAALLERLERAGLDPDLPVLRYEGRLWGSALRLDGLDATDPGAALDDELLGRLWAHLTTVIWLFDPASPEASRPRDRDKLPAWLDLRAAGGHPQPLRLVRAVAERQVAAVVDHARERLCQGAAVLDTLIGTGDGETAISELERAIAREAEWLDRTSRARAQHQQLLASINGGAT